jgi:hypothetical protein
VIAVGDSNVHGVVPHIFADAAVHDFLIPGIRLSENYERGEVILARLT